jgi:polyphosphate:AMP phosphotransferase
LFEACELGQKVSAKEFRRRAPELREALLDAQFRLQGAPFSVVIVVAGAEGAGKGETVNLLLEWLDARGVETHALDEPSEEERERPTFFRFWRRLPPKGSTAIFFGSWYTRPIASHSLGLIDDATFEDELRKIVEFEAMLAAEGVLLVKFWLHITKEQQGDHFKALAADKRTRWRVTKRDWEFHRTYDEFIRAASRALARTSSGPAPWHLVEAADEHYRHLTVAETLLQALEARLAASVVAAPRPAPEPLPVPPPVNIISNLDLGLRADPKTFERRLERAQLRMARRFRNLRDRQRSMVVVFEGPDAAGKGGAIRRITHALDARYYRVVPIAAPTDEERARPYLWRFWRHLPRWGHATIFDRSWYGRVLVERVEGFATTEDWQRAFGEINAFEEELTASGVIVVKFWMAISKEEQLRRFNEREATGFKRYKITDEDWRNREKWDAYVAAACEMVERTSSLHAPWTLVEAEDKLHARLKVVETLQHALERAVP